MESLLNISYAGDIDTSKFSLGLICCDQPLNNAFWIVNLRVLGKGFPAKGLNT